MATSTTDEASGKVVIKNIGLLLSGDIDQPILQADTIVILDGLITAVGRFKDLDTESAKTVIDARQTCVGPGLIDSHVHPVFGDWTPRQNQIGWIDSTMNGGVTTMVSAGEVHLPGRPKDIVGLKALAITAQRAFSNFRPGGVKVIAGAPIIEKGMTEHDFQELAAAGVTLLGEVGLGSVKAGYEAKEMVAWARKYGIQSTIHTGGPSVPGSSLIDKDVVLEADAAAKAAMDLKCPHRVILGTDGPAGSGVQPLGMLRMIALLSSLANIPAELVFCFATGNTARIRKLNCGLIEVGRAADLVFLDRAQGTSGRTLLESVQLGDIPGVGMVMIDGLVRCGRSRNTPPATEVPVVEH
ncbi:MAG: Enamidase [Betaproteobacteria bacterium]|nr:Enamidase [Betaproteobacteria bacterium]